MTLPVPRLDCPVSVQQIELILAALNGAYGETAGAADLAAWRGFGASGLPSLPEELVLHDPFALDGVTVARPASAVLLSVHFQAEDVSHSGFQIVAYDSADPDGEGASVVATLPMDQNDAYHLFLITFHTGTGSVATPLGPRTMIVVTHISGGLNVEQTAHDVGAASSLAGSRRLYRLAVSDGGNPSDGATVSLIRLHAKGDRFPGRLAGPTVDDAAQSPPLDPDYVPEQKESP